MQGIMSGIGDAIKNTSLKYIVSFQLTDFGNVANGFSKAYMFTTRRIKDFLLSDTQEQQREAALDMFNYLIENAQQDPTDSNAKYYPAHGICIEQHGPTSILTIESLYVENRTYDTVINFHGRHEEWVQDSQTGLWTCYEPADNFMNGNLPIMMMDKDGSDFSYKMQGSVGNRICTPLK